MIEYIEMVGDIGNFCLQSWWYYDSHHRHKNKEDK
jgi:hypothetical protein